MPTTDGYGQGISYPVLSDAPNIETAFQSAVNGIAAQTVLKFANANERAAKLTGAFAPVPGMITYLAAEDRWEARRSNGSWLLLSDGPWQPFSYATGYTAQGGSPGWRQKAGGGVELRGRIRRTNGGNLSNDGSLVAIAVLPSTVTPAATRYFVSASNRVTIGGVTHYTARVEVSSDSTIRYTVEAGGGVGSTENPPWLSLDGISFSPAGD